jgi:hypothetical protein
MAAAQGVDAENPVVRLCAEGSLQNSILQLTGETC